MQCAKPPDLARLYIGELGRCTSGVVVRRLSGGVQAGESMVVVVRRELAVLTASAHRPLGSEDSRGYKRPRPACGGAWHGEFLLCRYMKY